MAAVRREMREVELVEADAETAPATPLVGWTQEQPAGPDVPATPRLRVRAAGRVRRWWPVAAGLALAAVTGSIVGQVRDNARVAALADVPGIVAPLDGPVGVLWRADSPGFQGLAISAGLLIGVDSDVDGGADLLALDPATGDEVWRTRARGENAGEGWTTCALPERAAAPTGATRAMLCVVVDGTETLFDDEFGSTTVPTKARLLTVDAASGDLLASRPTDPTTAVVALGEDVVISHTGADGRIQIERSDALGTATRWTFASEDPVTTDALGRPSVWVSVVEDLVVVNAINTNGEQAGGSEWVLSGDGDVVHSMTVEKGSRFDGWIGVQPGGRQLTVPTTTSSGGSATDVIDLATGATFTADAFPLFALPNDGSLADLIIMTSPGGADLIAYDLTSGRPLWTVQPSSGAGGMDSGSAVIMDGRIIRAAPDQLTSVDGRTGETVWSTPLTAPDPTEPSFRPGIGSLVSDGRVALLTRSDADGGYVLTAYGLDDGRQRWETTLGDDLYLTTIDGTLFGWSEDGLVALGTDAGVE